MILLSTFIATLILWVGFVAATSLKPHLDHDHNAVTIFLIKVYAVIFIAGDAFFNFTYGTLIFLELPSFDRPLLTNRLVHILETRNQDEWRWGLAYFFCRYMIEPWDWNHCRIAYLYDPK